MSRGAHVECHNVLLEEHTDKKWRRAFQALSWHWEFSKEAADGRRQHKASGLVFASDGASEDSGGMLAAVVSLRGWNISRFWKKVLLVICQKPEEELQMF